MNLTKTAVDRLTYSKIDRGRSDISRATEMFPADYYWDDQLKGFGVRVYPTGRKSFVITYRNETNSKRFYTLGNYGVLTVAQAREMAKDKLASVRDGNDPQAKREEKRSEITFQEAASQYIDRKEGRKKSLQNDIQRLRDHILPVIGSRKLSEITLADLDKMIRKIKDNTSPSTANRCIALLKHVLRLEMKDQSPAIDLKSYPEPPPRDIVLHPDQINRLIEACDEDENRMTASLFKMAMFTGRRPGELRTAKWEHINIERGVWRLPETKAGEQQFVTLSENAREILSGLSRIDNNPYVFVGLKCGKPINHYHRAWKRILKRAGLEYMPPYGLRHNFASLLVAGDVPLATVRQLMGHKSIQTTMRYTHHRSDHLMKATDKFGEIISFTESKNAKVKSAA